ncbi:MAG: mannose-1-phosphate guanylyltransferase/mannose-6-phosphate isomerase [Deltaproteobacteria bacterium]|jgi:mannose-1-phosphate guanylyltransferase/mannose-6-phosphate isomerase|nr:mannose-1-phosphate guanylyltransferase/mannose-6-phosphate isomerase [Deltaproteobacteria bacterium]
MPQILPVILAGGTGTRLWPLSRELYPKQLLNLTEDVSLLQATIKRIAELPGMHLPLVVVVGEEYRFLIQNQIVELDLDDQITIILEPVGRDTAPAICGAAVYALSKYDEDTLMLAMPADHLISRPEVFLQGVEQAQKLAAEGKLVTFGITPHSPETGYGYIQKGEGNEVLSFVEKPDKETAEKYLAEGNYYWNSGIFAFTLKTFLSELRKHSPQISSAMEGSVDKGRIDEPFFRLDLLSMEGCVSESIDYALMEKSDRIAIVPVDMEWSDIGSWQALWDVSEKDKDGNVVHGDVVLEDVQNSLVRAEHRLVAGVGLDGTLVVETADAVLVAPLAKAQDVKKIVARIKADEKEAYRLHRTVYRPWGSYTVLEEQPRYKIKRITVNPGAKLSLQMHHHRAEHWVVVKGTAKVTCGEKTFLVHENESTYISAGKKHRLENDGVIPLELIEVQNGSYLGEDDIVRFDDVYGRDK